MTFEEKLDRLVERHEALTQSVESLAVTTRENTDSIRALTDDVGALTKNIEKLVEVSNRDGVDILKLARIAENHESRLSDLEEGH